MPDLLLELHSEEIPARMQARAAEDLRRLVTDALVERGFLYEGARTLVGPRRVALHVAGLPAAGEATREERRGPRVGAPEAAIQGFLRSAGLADISQARVQDDGKKGQVYLAVIERPGRTTIDVLAEVLPALLRDFPWPKSMRWGAASAQPGAPRWVRPLRAIVATFGPETEEPEIVRFALGDVESSNVTFGHRQLHGPAPIRVRRLEDYVASLEAARVVADAERRRDMIRADATDLAFASGLELVEDEALLEEVAGLVEWPVVLMGTFDEAFLRVPDAAIRATIRANQKCFVLRDPATGRLANRFILVANTEAADGGATIVKGNERVIRARLSDARFFFETDLKVGLEARLEKLETVRFHEKVGSQGARVARIVGLAKKMASHVGASKDLAARAAHLAKADLSTEMVGEFPELQGIMGELYARATGEAEEVSKAISEHYKPVGPNDSLPSGLVSTAVALADKLDQISVFFFVGEIPTGSKDPFALRRAALGLIRIIVEKKLSINLTVPMMYNLSRLNTNKDFSLLLDTYLSAHEMKAKGVRQELVQPLLDAIISDLKADFLPQSHSITDAQQWAKLMHTLDEVVSFLHDRLKVWLRERGARHDLVDAALGGSGARDDLAAVAALTEALGRFLATEDGANLLAGTRRAANILRAEERKDGAGAFEAAPDPAAFVQEEERALSAALDHAQPEAARAAAAGEHEAALAALAGLRGPVDRFFDAVMVNAPEPELRRNRLALLARLRRAARNVADFGAIAGDGERAAAAG